ncbi:glutamate-cysteine ligase family protein [Streptococcus sp. sy010]|uniref:glutamate-cysteine ligase family protein n=1 Tax=Streptococcus sp. sy010 TaxID=2600148 RepID=UPI0011B3D95F|nr:glutamate-cysteine ligase family protein [Streptococcus sp. sy010]TWT13355.1 gamma-glutamylcysteine synthetase [Streptococcus sp. sy010]
MTRPEIELLKKAYLEHLKDNPKLYLGIELEFPIVNLSGQATDIQVTKKLLVHLADCLGFDIIQRDVNGNPIQLLDSVSQDQILFEVSYNILEIAFGRSETIQQVEERFQQYMKVIQGFLRKHHHALQGQGIHPSWKINDNRSVDTPRYQMLTQYLSMSSCYPQQNFHPYRDYGGFICGSQVQLDVSKTNYLRVLNAFNQLEAVKAYLFANSSFIHDGLQLSLARDYFWEASMHGFFKENIGLYPQSFQSEHDFLNYLSQSSLFYVMREGEIYYFPPIQVKDYLHQKYIDVFDLTGKKHQIKPLPEDLEHHRSYHYQLLTRRGTVEFRSVCCQSFNRTFASAAFHLGLLVNLDQLEQILDEHQESISQVKSLRTKVANNNLDSQEESNLKAFALRLLQCAREGLVIRGNQEESYLTTLIDPLI